MVIGAGESHVAGRDQDVPGSIADVSGVGAAAAAARPEVAFFVAVEGDLVGLGREPVGLVAERELDRAEWFLRWGIEERFGKGSRLGFGACPQRVQPPWDLRLTIGRGPGRRDRGVHDRSPFD
jgi:hypothetical protein